MFGLFVLSFLNKFFMTPVANKTALVEENEGKFRFKHASIIEHSESLAFQGISQSELLKANKSLDQVCSSQEQLFNWTLPLDFSTSLFSYLGSIACYLVISVPIFSGHYDNLSSGEFAKMISKNVGSNIMILFT